MTTTPVWRPLYSCVVDGEPVVLEAVVVQGGYRVRVQVANRAQQEDTQVWATLEEARGRGLQMADLAIEQLLK